MAVADALLDVVYGQFHLAQPGFLRRSLDAGRCKVAFVHEQIVMVFLIYFIVEIINNVYDYG